MNKTVIIFGAHGGIGQATVQEFTQANYTVIPISRTVIDFNYEDFYDKVSFWLESYQPDVIVNCAGHFDSKNIETHYKSFNINVGSNWSILQYYMNNSSKKPVNIIMVGSSAYRGGRKDYILYAASKAALYNVWQGACDFFSESNITIGLINPVRTRTPMIDMTTKAFCYEPKEVADIIVEMASSNTNQLVDMKYPEEK